MPPERRAEVVRQATRKLDAFVFVGLQEEPAATNCMLRRVVAAFDRALGISPPAARSLVAAPAPVRNAGSYALRPDRVWASMSPAQRAAFEQREWVDLHIFQHAVRLFRRHVARFACQHLVVNRAYLAP